VSARPFVRYPRPLPPRRPAAPGDVAARAGFSLIELMVAMVLLGLGILTVANMFPLGSRTQLRDRLRTSATELAQQKMEQLRMRTWSDADLDVGTHPDADGETLVLDGEGTFVRYWVVEAQTGSFADMKKVTTRVVWTYQTPDTIDLVTYFRR
jgi:prepilin-type N-terminal cleavage/methylation domain-containing protein